MDTFTREIAIPADLLLAVFPPAVRDEVPPISMWELAADAIRVREIRGELSQTAELPAIDDDGIRTVRCPDCDATGNGAPATRDPQRQLHWDCDTCNGTGEVRACHHCGEIVGDANECAACKVDV